MSSARPGSGRLADDRRAGGADHRHEGLRVDGPGGKFACRSAPTNSSRELLQCTRSIRPVIAFTRSTASARSIRPVGVAGVQAEAGLAAALGGRAHPVPEPGDRVERRAIAPLPPAVFSISSGSGHSICSHGLTQFATWTGSTSAETWPPCTIRPFAPIAAAA